jgi:hypothetical protein
MIGALHNKDVRGTVVSPLGSNDDFLYLRHSCACK